MPRLVIYAVILACLWGILSRALDKTSAGLGEAIERLERGAR